MSKNFFAAQRYEKFLEYANKKGKNKEKRARACVCENIFVPLHANLEYCDMMKKIVALCGVVMMALSAQATVRSGNCGANGDGSHMQWSLNDDTGVLQITGSGEMADYQEALAKRAPWCKFYGDVYYVTVAEGITSLGNYAFYNCENLETISLPSTLTKIGNKAFSGCYELVIGSLPNGVTNIGDNTFAFCEQITDFILPSQLTVIPDGMFYNTTLSSVALPSGLTTIGANAFYGCEDLTNIVLPASLQTIGSQAFTYCIGLQQITCLAVTPPVGSTNVFQHVDAMIPLYVPVGSGQAYANDACWSHFSNIMPVTRTAVEPVCAQPNVQPKAQKLLINNQLVIRLGDQEWRF